jgi:uncharacterized membrane-anchored protein
MGKTHPGNEKENRIINWINNPSKGIVLLISILWLISAFLLVFAVTDFFTESFFQRKFLTIYMLLATSAFTTVIIHIKYWSSKERKNTQKQS